MTRADGRSPEEMRPVTIQRGVVPHAEGSALIELGQTRVLCTASVEDKVPAWLRGEGKGWVTAEYGMLPRATRTRTVREVTRGRPHGRTVEIQRLVGRALRAAIVAENLGERTIWIDCDVLVADGGTRMAAVTGGFVALAEAVARLRRDGKLAGPGIAHVVAGVSVGVVANALLLDLTFDEDSQAAVDLNVVLTESGELVDVQGAAEQAPFARSVLQALLDLAALGVRQLVATQREVLGGILEEAMVP